MVTLIRWRVHWALVIVFVQFSQALLGWPLLGYWGMKGAEPFGDLTLTLAQIECELGRNNCGPQLALAPYIYGRPLVFFMSLFPSLLPFSSLIAWFILFCITLTFCCFVIKVNKFKALVLVLLTLLSPPYQLLVERMNVDVIVFFGVLTSAALFSKKRYLGSSILTITTVLVKFYTLILMVFYFVPSKRKHLKLFIFFVLILSIYTISGFKQVSGSLSSLNGGNFGFQVLFYWLIKIPNFLNLMAVSLIFAATIMCCWATWRYFSQGKTPLFNSRFSITIFWFFTAISIVIFLTISNWDYRIIFLNIPLALLICCSPRVQGVFSSSLWLLYVAINYLSFNVSGNLQFIGDVAIFLSISTFITLMGIGLKNLKI